MNIVQVRGVAIGEGITKVCVPIAYRTEDEIISQAESLSNRAGVDLVEWRADWYEDIFGDDCLERILTRLRQVLGDMPLIFTFRSAAEGGERLIRPEQYVEMLKRVIRTECADLLDVELKQGDETCAQITDAAHEAGVKVLFSNHDFHSTPSKEELVSRMCRMQELGADLCKAAVMPVRPLDVLTLLDATLTMSDEYATVPLITMSMSNMGVITRLAGEVFGSALTFASAGRASAPGQMNVEALRGILEIMHGVS